MNKLNLIWIIISIKVFVIDARNSDCFSDCFNARYNGIMSMYSISGTCIEWNKSSYKTKYPNAISNFCSMHDKDKPWCPLKNGFAYCDIPKCTKNDDKNGCIRNVLHSKTSTSVRIQWVAPENQRFIHSYITLLYNINNMCERFHRQLCKGCNTYLSSKIERFFMSCKSGKFQKSITNESRFDKLIENQDYIIYIIPLINSKTIGKIKRVYIKNKKLYDPQKSFNIRVTKEALTTLHFVWENPNTGKKLTKSEHYLVTLTKWKSNIEFFKRVINEIVEFSDLDMCTKYCLRIIYVNKDAQSEISDPFCTLTLAPSPRNIIMNDIESGSYKNTIISWTYLSSSDCPVNYRVEYGIRGLSTTNFILTNVDNVTLPELKLNVQYIVRVRAETKLKTDNTLYGPFSGNKVFYTNLDCFKECYSNNYHGIMSMYNLTGHCILWKHSPYHLKYPDAVSNFCSMDNSKNRPWCSTKHGWEYCEIPKCKESSKKIKCLRNIKYSTTERSALIQWKAPEDASLIHGYITLLHNEDNICESYHRQLCETCKGYVSADIDRYYSSCMSGTFIKSLTNETKFDNLRENTKYFVYVIHLISAWSVGNINNISIKTQPLQKPDKPVNIRVMKQAFEKLIFEWDKPSYIKNKKQPDYYLATLTKMNSKQEINKRITSENAEFSNLDKCTEYCLQITAVNNDNKSDLSDILCTSTLASSPGNVILNDIGSGPYSNKIISWRYSAANDCPVYYRLEYSIKNDSMVYFIETNFNSMTSPLLENNFHYLVKIRAQTKMKADKLPYGPFSEAIEISSYNEQFYHYLDHRKIFNNFIMDETTLKYKIVHNNKNTKIVEKHNRIDKVKVLCNFGELINVLVEFKKNNKIYEMPFNFSCGSSETQNIITNLTYKSNSNSLDISWNIPKRVLNNYIIYWMNNVSHFYKYTMSERTSYSLGNLVESDWHQICVATIDNKWQTSKYICSQYSIYPEPVINVRTYSLNNIIYVSWDKLQKDIHHGYVVNVTSSGGHCQTTIIKMYDYCFDIKDYCRDTIILQWKFLKTLTIKNLTPDTKYMVSISSLKGTFLSLPTIVNVTPNIEETVRNLQVFGDEFRISLQFNAPLNAKKLIMAYKVKVTLRGLNMCSYKHNVIFNDIINTTSKLITTNFSMNCFGYNVEVIPVRQCNKDQKPSEEETLDIYNKPLVTETFLYKITGSPKTLRNLDVNLISLNLMKLTWSNAIPMNECENFGFMVALFSVVNETECKMWIITRTTCTTLIEKMNNELKCKNKEYLIFHKENVGTSLLLHGNFRISITYIVKIWRITDNIKLLMTKDVRYNKGSDCFIDCYDQKYTGIRSGSINGRICLKWKEFLNVTVNSSYRSNICHMDKSKNVIPWCFNEKYSHRVTCDIPTCKSVLYDNNCPQNIQLLASKTSIKVRLPRYVTTTDDIRGYIILLHNTDHECEKYIIKVCTNCINLLKMKINIQSFYMSCSSGTIINNWNQETVFTNLETHKEYIIYIIPLLSHASVGEILNVTIATRLSDSTTPHSMKLVSIESNYLKITWNSYKEQNNTTYIDYYTVALVNMKWKTESSKKCENEIVEFSNLEMCTKYCIYLTVAYKSDLKEIVDSLCIFTLSSNNNKCTGSSFE